jgi:hypothetical protein
MKKETNSKKEIEEKIRNQLKEASETLARLPAHARLDMEWLNPAIQGYTSYLNYISQERTLRHIRITAYATVVLAIATLVLAGVTAFNP